MVTNSIQAIVSKRKLTFIPDFTTDAEPNSSSDHEFDVIVTNASSQFASFQLELLAPGLDAHHNGEWYTVEPEICAKKPPGAQTHFHVVIKKAPIPAYDTTLDLTLRVFSVESANLFTSQPISLTIEKPRKSLRLFLPSKTLKVFPGDQVEIPVIIYNLNFSSTTVVVRLIGLDPTWMVTQPDQAGLEQELAIEPGESIKTSFYCQPPPFPTSLSQAYGFTVTVKSQTSYYSTREQGVLQVLPQGAVNMTCDRAVQTIATTDLRKRWGTATYELDVENCSNQPQEVAMVCLQGDRPQPTLIAPPPLVLNAGETQTSHLIAQQPRPWLGRPQRLLFQVLPTVTAADGGASTIQPYPSSKTLELRVLPLIPLALQMGGVILALLVVWMGWMLHSDGHHSTVNFVRFSGDGTTVLSGSNDQTVRRWFVNRTIWQPDRLLRGQWRAQRLKQPDNIGEQMGKPVRVIRHGRKNNLVAVGLEDGTIQLWNTALTTPQQTLYQGTDRVFDLVFTQDSRLLFSGHGSGMVRRWAIGAELQASNTTRQTRTTIGELYPATATEPERIYLPFAVSALALSEPHHAPPLLVVAGQFNQLVLWDWVANQLYSVSYRWQEPPDAFALPIVGKQHTITSVATAQNLLVTADNQGYITVWDMATRQCQLPPLAAAHCDLPMLDQWRSGHGGEPVRSVALTADGDHLASTGDDGRVMLWPLQDGKRQAKAGIRLADYPIRLNSVDITQKADTLWITSDADGDRVMLYRIPDRSSTSRPQNYPTAAVLPN